MIAGVQESSNDPANESEGRSAEATVRDWALDTGALASDEDEDLTTAEDCAALEAGFTELDTGTAELDERADDETGTAEDEDCTAEETAAEDFGATADETGAAENEDFTEATGAANDAGADADETATDG